MKREEGKKEEREREGESKKKKERGRVSGIIDVGIYAFISVSCEV